MSDLISSQAAIDAICEHGTDLERRGITVLSVANHKQVTVDLLEALPSAQPKPDKNPHPEQPDSDRLEVKTDETCSDTISRQNVLRCLTDISYNQCKTQGEADVIDTAKTMVAVMSSAQPEITPDGTLNVSIDADIASVGRILLSQTGTQRGGLYYKDEQPEIIRCRECKFLEYDSIFDGHFCQNRRVKLDHFCGYAERRTDGTEQP